MIPRYGEWEKRFGSKGFRVVGVHSPETEAESVTANVRDYVKKSDIRWTVLIDRYLDAWRRYNVSAWPTMVLIDRDGVVRQVIVGEGRGDEMEREIARLLGS